MKKSAIGQDPPSSTQLRHRPWNHNSSVPNGVKTPPLPLFPKLFPTTPFQIEVTAIMTNDTSARLFNIAWPPLAKYVFIDAHHPTPERNARGNFPSSPSLPLLRTSCGINNQFSFRRKSEPSVSLSWTANRISFEEGGGRGGDPKDISYWPTCGCFLRRPTKENNEWY